VRIKQLFIDCVRDERADAFTVAVGDTKPTAWHIKAVGDSGQNLYGHHPATSDDLRYLRLRLSGECGDTALAHTMTLQDPIDAGDVTSGQRRADVGQPYDGWIYLVPV
jgi:hypothetical protein